jgi:hypothetical protein
MLSLVNAKLIDSSMAWISPLQMSCDDSIANFSDPGINAVLHSFADQARGPCILCSAFVTR